MWRLRQKTLRIAYVGIVHVILRRTLSPICPLEICSSIFWSYRVTLLVALKILLILATAMCWARNFCKLLIPIQIGMLQLQTIDDSPAAFRWPYSCQESAGMCTRNSLQRIEQAKQMECGNMPVMKMGAEWNNCKKDHSSGFNWHTVSTAYTMSLRTAVVAAIPIHGPFTTQISTFGNV